MKEMIRGFLILILAFSSGFFMCKGLIINNVRCQEGYYNGSIVINLDMQTDYADALETFNHEWAHHTYYMGKKHFCGGVE